ncbi:hypothetical protein HY468_05450 [Candidatus Roizmanbacteria bacterium]|nr:hypothetical protein [Candidatus Roizmanbacteria bacterium]
MPNEKLSPSQEDIVAPDQQQAFLEERPLEELADDILRTIFKGKSELTPGELAKHLRDELNEATGRG